MLLDGAAGQKTCMGVVACRGRLPDAALQASIGRGVGIAGRAPASREALLVADIGHSEFAVVARKRGHDGSSLMWAPIRIDGSIAGAIHLLYPESTKNLLYPESTKTGFESMYIVGAASKLIGQLHLHLLQSKSKVICGNNVLSCFNLSQKYGCHATNTEIDLIE